MEGRSGGGGGAHGPGTPQGSLRSGPGKPACTNVPGQSGETLLRYNLISNAKNLSVGSHMLSSHESRARGEYY